MYQEGTPLEVDHVKAPSTSKEKQEMTLFERFVFEGHERNGLVGKRSC